MVDLAHVRAHQVQCRKHFTPISCNDSQGAQACLASPASVRDLGYAFRSMRCMYAFAVIV